MADTEWGKLALEAGVSLVSGLGGLLIGAWKWGRKGAKAEQTVKDDYEGKIGALREQTRVSMDDREKANDDRNDLLVAQFKESFDGIRRQIDENRLDTEKHFLRKDDFKDFREEYRQDMRRIFDKLDSLPR